MRSKWLVLVVVLVIASMVWAPARKLQKPQARRCGSTSDPIPISLTRKNHPS